jgi:RNA polymerase sigma-70 factor (ECF subfamily)
MPDDSSSDFEIVRRVVEGDVNAFEQLLLKYKHYVFKIVNKHIPYDQVEETAHDVFVKAYQSLPGFKGKSGFKQWLAKIAVRTCYDFWRKAYRSRELPMSSLTIEQHHRMEKRISDKSDQFHSQEAAKNEAEAMLKYALDKLSPEDRMVIELVYLEGLSGKEAAELLGWSLANVKVRLFRSRKKLQKLLED